MNTPISAPTSVSRSTPSHAERTQSQRLAFRDALPDIPQADYDAFAHALVANEDLVSCYFEPQVIASGGRCEQILPLEAALRAGRRAASMSVLLPHERQVAHLAAFLQPCGLFLCAQASTIEALGIRSLDSRRCTAARYILLVDAIAVLRRANPGLGSTLGAVLQVEGGDDVDPDQVARIATAARLATLRLNALWTDAMGRGGV